MRTTIDLPDELYRHLKARAALSGLRVRELVTQYLEQGLRTLPEPPGTRPRSEPPVAVPPTGVPIAALPRAELARLDEEEELARDARPARR
jgi:hypothetical protein